MLVDFIFCIGNNLDNFGEKKQQQPTTTNVKLESTFAFDHLSACLSQCPLVRVK